MAGVPAEAGSSLRHSSEISATGTSARLELNNVIAQDMKANKTKTSSKRLNTRKPESKPEEAEASRPWRHESGWAPARDEVATAAYYNYLNEGKPQGQAMRHWLDAETQLSSRSAPGDNR